MSWFCNTEEAKEHKRTCKKNPNYCDECVWIEESGLAMGRYGKFVEKPLKKTKIIETKPKPTPFDNLAKKVVNKQVYDDFNHPLYKEIIRVFKKEKE